MRSNRKLLLMLFTASLFTWAVSAYPGTEIILRPDVEISTQKIRLRDIAQVRVSDETFRRKLEAVEIGRANMSGKPQTVTALHVRSRIIRERLDASRCTIVGSKSVVHYKALVVSPETILAGAQRYYREQLMAGDDLTALDIRPRTPIRALSIPTEEAALHFSPVHGDLWKGRLEVQAIHNGAVVNRRVLSFDLSLLTPVIVAAQDIPRHAVIRPTHMKLDRRRMENPNRMPFTDVNEVIGKAAARPISQGEIVTPGHLKKNDLVSKGDVVTIIAQSGSLSVRAKGKALESGEQGEFIRVMNLASKKELLGEVAGDNLVRVHF